MCALFAITCTNSNSSSITNVGQQVIVVKTVGKFALYHTYLYGKMLGDGFTSWTIKASVRENGKLAYLLCCLIKHCTEFSKITFTIDWFLDIWQFSKAFMMFKGLDGFNKAPQRFSPI